MSVVITISCLTERMRAETAELNNLLFVMPHFDDPGKWQLQDSHYLLNQKGAPSEEPSRAHGYIQASPEGAKLYRCKVKNNMLYAHTFLIHV